LFYTGVKLGFYPKGKDTFPFRVLAKVLRHIFGSERQEVTQGVCTHIIRVIKSNKTRWANNVARVKNMKNSHNLV